MVHRQGITMSPQGHHLHLGMVVASVVRTVLLLAMCKSLGQLHLDHYISLADCMMYFSPGSCI